MTEKILKNNQAVVAGEIISDFEFSHEVFGEGFYFVKLKVSRLSHSSDIIPLLVSERLIDVSQSHIGQFLSCFCCKALRILVSISAIGSVIIICNIMA